MNHLCSLACILISASAGMLSSCTHRDNRFEELNQALDQREQIWADYHKRAEDLKVRFAEADSVEQSYIADTLFQMYVDAFPDSSFVYARKRVKLLENGNDRTALLSAIMDTLRWGPMIYVQSATEAFLKMDTALVNSCGLTRKYLDYGIMMCYRMIGFLDAEASAKYMSLYSSFLEKYRQIDSTSARYAFFRARQLRIDGDFTGMVDLLLPYCTDPDIQEEDLSVLATYLGRAYVCLGDNSSAEKWYAKSAVCDIHCAKHLHMSLAKLAMLLAYRGESDLALRYGTVANEEALSYNGEQRIVEMSPFLSKVSDEIIRSERRLRVYTTITAIVSLFLLMVAVIAVGKLAKMYRRTSELNKQISRISLKLKEANMLKENYMMHYMVKCTKYIRTVDDKVSGMKQMFKSGGLDGLVAELRKPKYSDSEFKTFYQEFDSTFLRLFPSFIDEVNAHVTDGCPWSLSRDRALPMELRILAVMKIGITNNGDIAAFLNFPKASIYTYRYRLKKSFGLEDESLEQFVLTLKI